MGGPPRAPRCVGTALVPRRRPAARRRAHRPRGPRAASRGRRPRAARWDRGRADAARARSGCHAGGDRLAGIRSRPRPRGSALRSRLGRRPGGGAPRTSGRGGWKGALDGRDVLCDRGPVRRAGRRRHAAAGSRRRPRRFADPDPDPGPRRGLGRLPDLPRDRRLGWSGDDHALGAWITCLRRRPSPRSRRRHRGRCSAGRAHRGRPAAGGAESQALGVRGSACR